MHLLFDPAAENWTLIVFPNYKQFLFAILHLGAFVFMGLLIALKNVIDKKLEDAKKASEPEKAAGSRRVRVTGNFG